MIISDIIDAILEWMTPLEIFATIFTLICVWLTVKRNIWCWPMGIIGVSAYFFVFFENQLYADAGLQIIFLIQSIYGWYFWVYGKNEDIENVPIRRLKLTEQILTLSFCVILIFTIGWLSATFTDTDVAYLDAMVASISLIANLLLARKIIDNWPLWMFVDVVYVGLFIYKELYLTAGLYVVFFFMATTGLIQWRKEWLAQEA
ncbi:MAG: nicotinamide riboside transporter PnuC [Bacteroidetes bacterium]|jgi:nicotinamide mononucleotide transporter|nr:nicotinamide riboside transporter PnuC [Bacteroidota bacterium]MDF1863544.1 nicotinamide riboside transporter PnuC [Saprospiraceae bacterium]